MGGNYAYSINLVSNLPNILEESQDLDFLIFADAADIWGVDYNSSIEGNGIRSSVGVALDWPIKCHTNRRPDAIAFNR